MGGDFAEGAVSGAAGASANYVVSAKMGDHASNKAEDWSMEIGSEKLYSYDMDMEPVASAANLAYENRIKVGEGYSLGQKAENYALAFFEGWARGAQGVTNAFTAGLFSEKHGVLYNYFNRGWEDLGVAGNQGNSGFRTGQAGGRVAEGFLLGAGAAGGAGLLTRSQVVIRGSTGWDGGISMMVRESSMLTGRTIRVTQYAWNGARQLVHTHVKSQTFWPW